MARPQKKKLNDQKKEVINEEFLKASDSIPSEHDIVIAKHIPEIRKVMFINQRDPGYCLEFHYASATHPLKQYKLLHGFEYDLPIEIISHLESCAEKQYGYRKGLDGCPEMYVKGLKYNFSFRAPNHQRLAA